MPTDQTWAHLVPELSCTDIAASLAFYTGVLGFSVRFARPEDRFAYLEREGAELMLEQANGHWQTGPLERPLGRGVNFQVEVTDVQALHDAVVAAGVPLFRPLRTSWYRTGDLESGQAEFLVQDPDGYLLRFCQHLGERPLSGA